MILEGQLLLACVHVFARVHICGSQRTTCGIEFSLSICEFWGSNRFLYLLSLLTSPVILVVNIICFLIMVTMMAIMSSESEVGKRVEKLKEPAYPFTQSTCASWPLAFDPSTLEAMAGKSL